MGTEQMSLLELNRGQYGNRTDVIIGTEQVNTGTEQMSLLELNRDQYGN